MTIKNMNSLAFLFAFALLTLGVPNGNAAGYNSGASAPIPSTSQRDQNLNYDLSVPSGSRAYAYDNERFEEFGVRVQEDPNAGKRVMQREKPVSYFKRDASVGILPKR